MKSFINKLSTGTNIMKSFINKLSLGTNIMKLFIKKIIHWNKYYLEQIYTFVIIQCRKFHVSQCPTVPLTSNLSMQSVPITM